MPAMTYLAESIFLESHFLPGDSAELRLPCDSVTVTRDGLIVDGIETRHLQALVWMPEALSFEADGQQHQYKVARPAVKPSLRAYFPFA